MGRILEQPYFYFKKLDGWNIAGMVGYISFSLIGCIYCIAFTPEELPLFLLCTTVFTQGLLYFLGYKALRNMTFFLAWFAIALVQLFIYWLIKDIAVLEMHRPPAGVGFRNTVPLLLLFQLLRFISLKIQGIELIMPPRIDQKDEHDNRYGTFFDFIFFLTYFSAMLYLLFH
jgi:hypothetical protein